MTIDRFVLKMRLRKALSAIKGLRRHITDADEERNRVEAPSYEIVKKPGNAGFTFETPGGDGSV